MKLIVLGCGTSTGVPRIGNDWGECDPNEPKNIASETPFVAAKARLRKKRIGSIGAAVRSSWATKATSRTAPAAIEPVTSSEPQPAALPRTMP